MNYVSTRGETAPTEFVETLLRGLAPDGGLFMPERWPRFSRNDIAAFKDRTYNEIANTVLAHYVSGPIAQSLRADIDSAYADFDTSEVAPLVEFERDRYLLELFHGPTLAFKDIALQLMGRLVARALQETGQGATIVAATSGDTGAAAIAAFGGRPNIQLFVLHPFGRISEWQRRQMTTSVHANVHNVAIRGTFDEAQSIVKALFQDVEFARVANLMAVNSINFIRIAAQSVYYFTAASQLGAPAVFAVPTGNFGDVFAGEAAMRMGLPVERLLVATNANDIMVRALNEGIYAAGNAQATLTPAMDIQVASNFERALFEASDRDAAFTRSAFGNNQELHIPPAILGALQARYAAIRTDDDETLRAIREVYSETGRVIDPHTAVAVSACRKYGSPAGAPQVIVATAHPAKFPDTIEAAIGQKPLIPERLLRLIEQPENVAVLDARLPLVRAFIAARVAHHES